MLLALFAVLTMGVTGCGESSGADDATTSAFVGTWALYEGSAIQGNPTWYVHFKEDKTCFISDNADGTAVRVRMRQSLIGAG